MTKKGKDMASDILDAVRTGTKKWTKTIKTEERRPAARSHRHARMTQERGVQFKEAAAEILAEAYAKVSDDGSLPANARQLAYACRPHIQEATGKELEMSYFTQRLLPDFITENPEYAEWDIVYDSRGHFHEPHSGRRIGLGTVEVRQYLESLHDPEVVAAQISEAQVETNGPAGKFGAVLFVEKEGFDALLDRSGIETRLDIGIMSTKGMSVTAARKLADEMCAEYDIPLFLFHDFDKSGFSIAGTMQRDTRRYEFQNSITTIDIGLSLEDVNTMGLEPEYQYVKSDKGPLMDNLRLNGASEEEIEFMFRDFDRLHSLRRVELNAMTGRQFIDLIERRLREYGITKIVPDGDLLAETFSAMERGRRMVERFNNIGEIAADGDFEVPDDLENRIHAHLEQHPTVSWSEAVRRIVLRTGG